MIVEKINEYLSKQEKTLDEALRYDVEKIAGFVFKRQFMTDEEEVSKGKLRLSSAGHCARKNAYGYHGFPKKGKEIDGRAKTVFWLGDLAELTVISIARLAGCKVVGTGLSQVVVDFPVNGTTVKGHPDGISLDGKPRLVEVKSMSSYGYEKFEQGVIDEAYLAQVNCYMDALGLDECIFIGLNKESGVMFEMIVKKDIQIVGKCRQSLLSVMESTEEKLPPRWFEPDAKTGLLPWNCLYCAYWGHCWPGAEKVLVRGSYKLKLQKEIAK